MGQYSLIEQQVLQSDALGHLTNVIRYDEGNPSLQRTLCWANWTSTGGVPGDLKLSEIDENGMETIYS